MTDAEILAAVESFADDAMFAADPEGIVRDVRAIIARASEAGEAVADEQIGPVKAWCRVCEAVTPCSWRWNDNACADLCCDDCHNIHVCVHEFSDSDSQRLGALARAVMHDQVYHDTLAARVEELERAALASAQAAEGWKLVPVEPTESMRLAPAKDRPGFSRNVAAEIYRAMLAAAPNTPEKEGL